MARGFCYSPDKRFQLIVHMLAPEIDADVCAGLRRATSACIGRYVLQRLSQKVLNGFNREPTDISIFLTAYPSVSRFRRTSTDP